MFDPQTVLQSFCRILDQRLQRAGNDSKFSTVSEDTICLYLAFALKQNGFPANSIDMEFPHPFDQLKQRENKVDVVASGPSEILWFEVKFEKISLTASGLSQLIRDFMRTGLIRSGRRFILYVFPSEANNKSKAAEEIYHWLESSSWPPAGDALPRCWKVVQSQLSSFPAEIPPKLRLIKFREQVSGLRCYLYEVVGQEGTASAVP